jgi:peroxiredoxin
VARDEMGPQVGAYPPDFSLKRLDSDTRVRLSSFRGTRPVALVFGSYT